MSDYGCFKSIPWETRNIGRQCFAIVESHFPEITDELLANSLAIVEKKFGKIFVQVRVGKSYYAALPVIQRQGFYFIETTLVPHVKLTKNIIFAQFGAKPEQFLPSRFRINDLTLQLLDKKNDVLRRTVKAIAGESFVDDRFHLDPQCLTEIADGRFSKWVDDLLADPAVVFDLLIYNGACIGFMARKAENLILAGFAKKHVGSGLGDFLWLSVLQRQQQQGFTHSHTMISANNTAVLNLYARLGFKFKEPSVTLHYWSA